ncbi:MAG: DUF1080 domain-containing protein [Candidatus Hydrogenedentes bacterium]|nr:DUF1080 domain-containing protein [Candidatus Hydrogenedentota bacterium]
MTRMLLTAGLVLGLTLTAFGASQKELELMGNFEGSFTSGWPEVSISAQIVALGKGKHLAKITIDGIKVEVTGKTKGKAEDGLCLYDDTVDAGDELGGKYRVVGQVTGGIFTATVEGNEGRGTFELKRVVKGSPTMGKKAPAGATVLLGKSAAPDAFVREPLWQIFADGVMKPSYSSAISKEEFGSAQYHIEFKTPFMPEERGQGRGNSGVYLMGRYEMQVLDSYTEEPRDNFCGGIYKKAVPIVNACAPPEEWQTYDITFHAPQFDASGKKTKDAMFSAVHNGIVIHDKVVLPDCTPGGVSGEEAARGVLMLQYHHNDVSYRNVWIQPID